ncbi:MAG: DUF805 domain-containing protein [Candidatus Nanopelagicales bacterium]
MSFSQSVKYCLNHYASFDGRASRSEFWWFYLFCGLVSGIPIMIAAIFMGLGTETSYYGDIHYSGVAVFGFILYGISALISLAFFIPLLAVGCRRLHDRGTSGWLQLLLMVPCANFVVLVFWLLEGTSGPNAYGDGPAKI